MLLAVVAGVTPTIDAHIGTLGTLLISVTVVAVVTGTLVFSLPAVLLGQFDRIQTVVGTVVLVDGLARRTDCLFVLGR